MTVENGRERPAVEGRAPRLFLVSQRVALQLDRVVMLGVALLLFVTPLTVDSDEPWQYSVMEAAVLLLVGLWMARVLLQSEASSPRQNTLKCDLGLPLTLFAAVMVVQLVPMPPTLLHALSPATYRVYSNSLSGWPGKTPYSELLAPAQSESDGMGKSKGTVPQGPAGTPEQPADSGTEVVASGVAGLWRPVTIASEVTRRVSLKFIAYGCLFFLAAFYPFGLLRDQREVASLCRRAVIAVLTIGLLVGVIGLLRRLTDDDQSLWLFIAQDWQRYDLSAFRASGPFVDPDHFANYLNLILPFAVTGLLFPRLLGSRKYQFGFRWFCGLVGLVLVAALVGSASRAGWIGAVVSIAGLTWLCGYMPAESRPRLLRLKGQSRLLVPASLAGALVLALIVAGPLARTQADNRLITTDTGDEFSVRLEVAEDSLRMVRDFPLLGVGLGCWADLFPRYCRPPWSSSWWGETHNDYVQLLAETGLLGFLCLAWVFARIGKELYIHCPATDSTSFPIFAAIVSAAAATAFHEFVDFPLHLSANAFLFTLWLGLAVRIATTGDNTKVALESGRRMANWSCAGVGVAALVLAVVAMVQGDEAFFPYEVGQLQTPAQVRDFMLVHPANSRAHLMLAKLMADRMTPERLGEEATTALWLEPTNPVARDIQARSLFARNQEARALKEITRSVFFSPTPASHFYLAAERVAGLSMRERAAVEEGFEMAVERRFPDAVQGLGDFYHSLGEPSKESRAYMNGAAAESDPALRAQYLINAGLAFSRAKEWSGAEDALQKAAALVPNNPTPYQALITVYGAARDMTKARAVLAQGREGGVQPFPLYSALAQLQINSGDTAGAQASLLEAVKYRPADFQTLLYLGQVYMQRQEFERAIIWLKRAVESNPRSADALAQLAEAEQSSYHYFEADRSYRKALQLAPANASLRAEYGAFQRKIRQVQRDDTASLQ